MHSSATRKAAPSQLPRSVAAPRALASLGAGRGTVGSSSGVSRRRWAASGGSGGSGGSMHLGTPGCTRRAAGCLRSPQRPRRWVAREAARGWLGKQEAHPRHCRHSCRELPSRWHIGAPLRLERTALEAFYSRRRASSQRRVWRADATETRIMDSQEVNGAGGQCPACDRAEDPAAPPPALRFRGHWRRTAFLKSAVPKAECCAQADGTACEGRSAIYTGASAGQVDRGCASHGAAPAPRFRRGRGESRPSLSSEVVLAAAALLLVLLLQHRLRPAAQGGNARRRSALGGHGKTQARTRGAATVHRPTAPSSPQAHRALPGHPAVLSRRPFACPLAHPAHSETELGWRRAPRLLQPPAHPCRPVAARGAAVGQRPPAHAPAAFTLPPLMLACARTCTSLQPAPLRWHPLAPCRRARAPAAGSCERRCGSAGSGGGGGPGGWEGRAGAQREAARHTAHGRSGCAGERLFSRGRWPVLCSCSGQKRCLKRGAC